MRACGVIFLACKRCDLQRLNWFADSLWNFAVTRTKKTKQVSLSGTWIHIYNGNPYVGAQNFAIAHKFVAKEQVQNSDFKSKVGVRVSLNIIFRARNDNIKLVSCLLARRFHFALAFHPGASLAGTPGVNLAPSVGRMSSAVKRLSCLGNTCAKMEECKSGL